MATVQTFDSAFQLQEFLNTSDITSIDDINNGIIDKGGKITVVYGTAQPYTIETYDDEATLLDFLEKGNTIVRVIPKSSGGKFMYWSKATVGAGVQSYTVTVLDDAKKLEDFLNLPTTAVYIYTHNGKYFVIS